MENLGDSVTTLQYNAGILSLGIGQALWFWLSVLLIATELRLAFGMFLQINPYFEPFATLWTFTDPVLNFGRLLYPKVMGWDTAPVANMALLSYFITRLDLFVFGPNEMNGNEGVEVMADAYKYTIVRDIMDSIEPENQKQWLESFTFEDIYFRRVPGAPSLEELSNDNLIIDTTMPGIFNDPGPIIEFGDPAPIVEFGIFHLSLTNPVFDTILFIINIPMDILHFLIK
jgi:hypothetical protein